MRLTTCAINEETVLGVVTAEGVQLLPAADGWPAGMLDWIAAGQAAAERFRRESASLPVTPQERVRFCAPIPRPRKNLVCLGKNYAAHALGLSGAEGDAGTKPRHPLVFTKAPTTVNGPYANIPFDPAVSSEIDWEVELAVVIGREGKNIARGVALEHVFGYTVLNDITARDIQYRHKQFFLGKSLDGACPMGPWIVTADEIHDPQNLDLRCWVNGVLKQEANTSEQLFSVAETISILSQGHTLEPGDIIATGTPSGVGFARKPPEFLRPGDVVECEIEGIGWMRNVISR
jgi:2-keto-4-pentenoate hydratase/2-oxohepta-3-ene-1,7-dioic acid hydratase in catechol pathway